MARRRSSAPAPKHGDALDGPAKGAAPGPVDAQARQWIEVLTRRVKALEGGSAERPAGAVKPARTGPLDRAMAKLRAYDDLVRQAQGREKSDLQRWRVKAAADVLRQAVTVVDGHVPDEVDGPLTQVEAACDPDSPLPDWLDPDSFVGMAVIVGISVLVTTGAAPLGAAVVGESMLKETVKTAITALVAGVLTEAGLHQLTATRRNRRSVR